MSDALNLDQEAVFAALPPGGRAFVRRLMDQLDVPVSAWSEIPAVRQYVETAAVLELADLEDADNRGDEIASACRALGLEDDPSRATRPSDSIYRRIRRWRRSGQSVQPPEEGAA